MSLSAGNLPKFPNARAMNNVDDFEHIVSLDYSTRDRAAIPNERLPDQAGFVRLCTNE
jgi:hypothetical protein